MTLRPHLAMSLPFSSNYIDLILIISYFKKKFKPEFSNFRKQSRKAGRPRDWSEKAHRPESRRQNRTGQRLAEPMLCGQ
jgi:hypothetical protein